MSGDLSRLLADLEQAHAAATRGPWEQRTPHGVDQAAGGNVGETWEAADAALIVAARNALPLLLDELRRRDETLAAVRGLAEEWTREALWLRDEATGLRAQRFPDSANLRDEEANELDRRVHQLVLAAHSEQPEEAR